MADKEFVPVYFIGVHYPPDKSLAYSIKGRVYQPQTVNGKLVVGGVMKVDPADVRLLIDKARIYKRNEGFFETFTTDPSIAAAVRSRYEAGSAVSISARMTLTQASALLSPEENKKAVVENMSVAELQAAIAAKLGDVEPADEQPEKIVEIEPEVKAEVKAASAAKPKTTKKGSEVVDETLK